MVKKGLKKTVKNRENENGQKHSKTVKNGKQQSKIVNMVKIGFLKSQKQTPTFKNGQIRSKQLKMVKNYKKY